MRSEQAREQQEPEGHQPQQQEELAAADDVVGVEELTIPDGIPVTSAPSAVEIA